MNAVDFKEVSIAFGKKRILNNITAQIHQGEFLGIFGPNGAGKTIMLRTILGLLKPISGSVLLYGNPPQRGDPAIGYMPQIRHDLEAFPLSGRSYLSAVINGSGWGWPHIKKKQRVQMEQVIELVGIQDYIDRPFTQFSGGERQHLALAQALVGQPQILLLDEPLSSLDPGQQEKTISLIKVIQQKLNITVLLTAHNINPLLGAMDRVLYLGHGKAAIGTIDEVVNSTTLSMLYDTPIDVIRSGKNVSVIYKTPQRDDHDDSHHRIYT